MRNRRTGIPHIYASSTTNAGSFGRTIREKTGIFLVALLDNLNCDIDNPLDNFYIVT